MGLRDPLPQPQQPPAGAPQAAAEGAAGPRQLRQGAAADVHRRPVPGQARRPPRADPGRVHPGANAHVGSLVPSTHRSPQPLEAAGRGPRTRRTPCADQTATSLGTISPLGTGAAWMSAPWGGLGRRLCLADDSQPSEDDPEAEDRLLRQQHEGHEGQHGTGSAWGPGAEAGGIFSEAIVAFDESLQKPSGAPLPQDSGSLRVATDDSADDFPSTASSFSADGVYSCPGRETQIRLGGDHAAPVIGGDHAAPVVVSRQLSSEESQIVDAFLHTTAATCANPERDITEAQRSESPEDRVVALRATTSASSSWGSSSTLPLRPNADGCELATPPRRAPDELGSEPPAPGCSRGPPRPPSGALQKSPGQPVHVPGSQGSRRSHRGQPALPGRLRQQLRRRRGLARRVSDDGPPWRPGGPHRSRGCQAAPPCA